MNTNTLLKSFLAGLLLATLSTAQSQVNVSGASGVALSGYDPVAFFTDSKAVHGLPTLSASYQGANYFFANEEHRSLFSAIPEQYAPQYGGFCAFGIGLGALLPVDIDTWQVRSGKLYLNLNAEVLKLFNADIGGALEKAEKNWAALGKPARDPQPAARLVNVAGASNIGLQGFDPVAFFTDSKATNGSPSIHAVHAGATYFFATQAHLEEFQKRPEAYLPQFGGYCAYGLGLGVLLPVDIHTWQVRGGKLYLNLNPEVLKAFNADFDAILAKAGRSWTATQNASGS